MARSYRPESNISTHAKELYVQLPTSADKVSLLAFAGDRRSVGRGRHADERPPLSIDISCTPDSQQQTRPSHPNDVMLNFACLTGYSCTLLQWSINGTDRRTDTVPLQAHSDSFEFIGAI